MEIVDDPQAAAWLDLGEECWRQTVALGPDGFAAHCRLRHIPDPTWPGQRESEVQLPEDHPDEGVQLWRAVEVLTVWTATPDDFWLAVWEGWPFDDAERSRLGEPVVQGCARSYHLLHGSLDAVREILDEGLRPAFLWPADRAWCLADDVDGHWAGIGASRPAVEALLTTPELDVAPLCPGQDQPRYAQ